MYMIEIGVYKYFVESGIYISGCKWGKSRLAKMTFDWGIPFLVIHFTVAYTHNKLVHSLWSVLCCVQAFWDDQGEERWVFHGSQNIPI